MRTDVVRITKILRLRVRHDRGVGLGGIGHLAWAALTLLVGSAGTAGAGIVGGFDAGDGYFLATSLPVDNSLVDRYNAGQYGTNNGGPGGVFTAITPGTGLWRELRPATNGYAVVSPDGNHTINASGPALDFRGGNVGGFRTTGAGNVDGEWRYTLDSRDLGGVVPASINNDRVITMRFYYCGGVAFQGDDPGVFRMGFADGAANEGLEFGLWDDSHLFYRGAGADQVTSVLTGPSGSYPWTYVRVILDFINDTFSIGISPSLVSGAFAADNAPPATWLIQNAPMSAPGMTNLTSIRFWVDSEVGAAGSTGVNNSNKQLVDDFRMRAQDSVPVRSTSWTDVKRRFGH